MTSINSGKNIIAGAEANRINQPARKGEPSALRYQQLTLKKIMHYFQGDYLYTGTEENF